MAVIKWTETALTDINKIAEFISLNFEFYARQFIRKIFDAAEKLEKFPEIGKIVPELPAYNYREILFKK